MHFYICNLLTHKKRDVELNGNIDILNAESSNGAALKFRTIGASLVYGCWSPGLYAYGPYANKGEPGSGYGGVMLTISLGSAYGYVKVVFSQDLNVYIGRYSSDNQWSGWNKK